MVDVLRIPCRPGDIIRQIMDDDGNVHQIMPPIRINEKGTLFVHVTDLATGDVGYESRKLRA